MLLKKVNYYKTLLIDTIHDYNFKKKDFPAS